jgi:hypothetical protein
MKSVIISLLLIATNLSYPLDTTSQKYFPMSVGNVYVFTKSGYPVTYQRSTITQVSFLIHIGIII